MESEEVGSRSPGAGSRTTSWRREAPVGLAELAVGKYIISECDQSRWAEVGLLTGTKDQIDGHPRPLQSLRFGDEDYAGCVYDMVSMLLGKRAVKGIRGGSAGIHELLPNLRVVAQHIGLADWLFANEPALCARLLVQDDRGIPTPEGAVLSGIETVANRLNVAEVRRQTERIRRDCSGDPEAAIGHAKELIESACKTILGVTGDGRSNDDLPALIKKALLRLLLDPTQAGSGPDARAAKRFLGSVAQILNGAGELRNARGAGHGRSGVDLVDETLARLVVGVVLSAVLYMVENWELRGGLPSVRGGLADIVGLGSSL